MSEPKNSPELLGDYELLEILDDRPDGRLYKARCVSPNVIGVAHGELVALKRFKTTGHEKDSEEFRRQGKALRALNHPNIAHCKDFFIFHERNLGEEVCCLVTELLEGESLSSLLARNTGGLRWAEARSLLLQILQALKHAHENGVIHRNLSLSAIQIIEGNTVKLMDFGIACLSEKDAKATSIIGAAKGAMDYRAPEFAKLPASFIGDEQSDVYSLGVCIWHIVTGSLPHPSLGEHATVDYLARWLGSVVPQPDPRQSIFRVLRRARACFVKCLEPDRERRFKSVAEVMDEFARITYRRLRHGEETYEFYEWLGKGGFGEVFHARRLSDGRELAVKRLFSAAHSARFFREARILRDSIHPNLVEYVDFVEVRLREDDREYYLVMEFLEGMPAANLRHCIKVSESGMGVNTALRLFSDYLACLEHLHQNGIIHRDIKPGNLYVPTGESDGGKIFDLGIAYDEEGTRTQGQVLGTLDYMPPEFATQINGRGSPQSDIYSLGVSLYQALTKKLPFPRLPVKESEGWVVFYQRAQRPVECSFSHPVFKEHQELVPVLRRALASTPAQRYPSAKAMRDELQAILGRLNRAKNKEAYVAAMAGAQAALSSANFDAAEQQVHQALEFWPADTAAAKLLGQVQAGRQSRQSYEDQMAGAWEALERDDYAVAENLASQALAFKPKDSAATQLVALAQEAKGKGMSIEVSLAAARAAFDGENFDEAENQANHVLEIDSANLVAAQLLTEVEEARFQKKMFEDALAAARLALEKGLWDEGQQQASAALRLKPDDAMARQLLSRAREGRLSQQAYETTLGEARQALSREDYEVAEKKAVRALELRPGDPVATQLLHQMRELVLKSKAFDAAMAGGQLALERLDFDAAEGQARRALEVRPGDMAASHLLVQVEEGRQKHKLSDSAISLARAALEREDLDEVENQAKRALEILPGNPVVTHLLSQAREVRRRRKLFDAALVSAQSALALGDYDRAEDHTNRALDLKPGDPAAKQLFAGIKEARLKKKLFEGALTAARTAMEQGNYDEAESQAGRALELQPGDVPAAQLLTQSQEARLKKKLFDAAVTAARVALGQGNHDDAESQAARALELRPGDSAAVLLVSQVKTKRRNHRLYNASMAAGEVAFAEEDYEEAERQAGRALGFNPEGEASKRLLSLVRERRPVRPTPSPVVRTKPMPVVQSLGESYGQFEQEGATAVTRPADLDLISKAHISQRHSKGKRK